MKRVLPISALFAAGVLLAGCTTTTTPPVGIGTGVNELKRSPCACIEIPMTIPAEFRHNGSIVS